MSIRREMLFLLLMLWSLAGGSVGKRPGTSTNTPRDALDTLNTGLNTSSQVETSDRERWGHPKPDDVQVGCKELRSKRYISDGFCTSVKPITEVVCTGHCLPIRNLPWYAEFIKVWARTKVLEWRCVDDLVRRRRVRLLCESGDTRTYRIKVVKSCKCKRYIRTQNQSEVGVELRHKNKRNKKRRRNKSRKNKSNKPKP